jgi:transcriptional regulator with XRE-family HTH domain
MSNFWAAARVHPARNEGNLSPVGKFIESQRIAAQLSQITIAERMEISDKTYRRWLMPSAEPSADRLETLARGLGLSREDKATLYRLAGRTVPSGEEALSAEELTAHRLMIDGIAHPAVLFGPCFDVVLTNAAFRELFRSVPPYGDAVPTRNTMRYILFNPHARDLLGGTDAALYDGWVMPSLAALSAVKQQRPGDVRVESIEQEIAKRPTLRRAYEAAPVWIRENPHVNSAPRRFVHPELGPTDVRLLTEAHLGGTLDFQRATFLFEKDQPTADASGT